MTLAGIVWAVAVMFAAPADTRVADAAQQADREAVRALLKQGVDVNAAQGDGMTALHWAASKDDVQMAEMLLYAGANVRATTRIGGITPLSIAAQNGNGPIVEALLKAGADPNAGTVLGVTPLMQAATSGDVDAIRARLDRGADINAKENMYEQTPLIFAAAFNRPEAIEMLIARGADAGMGTKVRMPAGQRGDGGGGRGAGGARGRQPAGQRQGQQQQQQQRQQPVDDEDEPRPAAEPMGGLTPLLYACRQDAIEAVRALLDNGAHIDQVSADSTTPLMMALINGHYDLAMYLLERGANPKIATMAGGTPLYRVLDVEWAPKSFYPQPRSPKQQKTTYLEVMKALLDRGADPNARLKREMWYSQYGFGLEGIDPAGATPFWRASQVGDVDAMRLLVKYGADPGIATNEGITPLQVLAGAGYHGNDAITIPAGRMPAMRYLVEELGANVNAVDEKAGEVTRIEHANTRGYTAVHNAAARGDNEMILYLVSKGARVDLVGKNGMTTVDMANGPRERIQPFPETIKLLESLGAKNNHRCVSC
jgi:ankyrin repeat protein